MLRYEYFQSVVSFNTLYIVRMLSKIPFHSHVREKNSVPMGGVLTLLEKKSIKTLV